MPALSRPWISLREGPALIDRVYPPVRRDLPGAPPTGAVSAHPRTAVGHSRTALLACVVALALGALGMSRPAGNVAVPPTNGTDGGDGAPGTNGVNGAPG